MTKLVYFKYTKPRSVQENQRDLKKIIAKFSEILWSNTLELKKEQIF